MDNSLLQPKDLAKICGIKKSTLNGYLSDTEIFPPAKVDENNNYRYYQHNTVSELNLFKALRKRPFRLKIKEIKAIFKKLNVQKMVEYHNLSKDSLYKYLKDNNCL